MKYMIIPVWNTEKEDKGYTLVLKEQFIELTIYDIPATSYRGSVDFFKQRRFVVEI